MSVSLSIFCTAIPVDMPMRIPPESISARLILKTIQLFFINKGIYSRANVASPANDHPTMLNISHDNGWDIVFLRRKY